MDPVPARIFLVSHTHWDREWYLPFHRFRTKLVPVIRGVMDRLEQGGEFRHFVLDGQSVLLEDFEEVAPEDGDRLRRLVRDGAIAVGPWYTLPDEFLVSAEAMVRNLLLGHAVTASWGPVQKVGYLPDSFGHIAQLPQILRRAGIDAFIYTRGNGDEIDELGCAYLWCGPDGSQVLAVNQCRGYCNAGGLGYEELWHAHTQRRVDPRRAVEQVRGLLAEMAAESTVLLNNGCDHFPAQPSFDQVLDALRQAWPETEFRHAGFADYIEAIREEGGERKRHTGELLGGRLHPILSGVWSARIYLKQWNDACQTFLSDLLEPVSAYGHFVHGLSYPAGEIDYAWKLLLKNHPHDSICGCSTDEVHEEMVSRFRGVRQTADQLLQERLGGLLPMFGREPEGDGATALVVVNPLPEVRREVVRRLLVLPPGTKLDALTLRDQRGEAVAFEVLESWHVERFWGIDYRGLLFAEEQVEQFEVYREAFGDRILKDEGAEGLVDVFALVEFTAEALPALGHRIYTMLPGPPAPRGEPAISSSGDSMANRFWQVRLHPDGSFDVSSVDGSVSYGRLHQLEDDVDVGDEYDHGSGSASETVRPDPASGTVRLSHRSERCGQLEAHFTLELPESCRPDRQGRSPRRRSCPVRVQLTLWADCPRIDIAVEFDNRVLDHRLRARFPSGLVSDSIGSEGHFLLQERPIERPADDRWVQPHPGTYPQQGYSWITDGERGVAVLNRGLPEVAAERDEKGEAVMLLTLCRSVGWLSRDDFADRRFLNAGPTVATPGAQCQGGQRFRYAVVPFAGDVVESDLPGINARYRAPVLTRQGVVDGEVRGEKGLLRKATGRTRITAIKRHQERDTLLVRLYNLTREPVVETLHAGLAVEGAWRTDLLEQRVGELECAGDRTVLVSLGPCEIASVEVALAIPER